MLPFPSHISIPSLLLFLLYATTTFNISISSNHNVVHCNEKDEEALFMFKQGIIDPSNRLSTWSNKHDCCEWEGVQCHNTTSRVTGLVLTGLYGELALEGEINLSWLLQLEFLNYLDLSNNNFSTVSIHDNITAATSLHYLDLSYNYYDLHMDNIHWLLQLSSLKYLNLSYIHIHKQTNWLQMVTMLPSLSELRLSYCGLTNIYSSLAYVNFTSLVTLDLSGNDFNSELPHWLFNISSDISHISLWASSLHGEIPSSFLNLPNLQLLYLSGNQLKGSIPNWLGQLKHLQSIYLYDNVLSGSIPSSLGNISSLIDLDISYNLLTGNIPDGLGQLVKLKTLGIGNNPMSGILSQMMCSKLSNLEKLDLSNSSFEFAMDTNWTPPFQLSFIDLSNTDQGPAFPAWLYTQRSLEYLYISGAGISSIDGDIFPSFVAGITEYLDLSYNSISGDISNVKLSSEFIYLDHNKFTGRLPHISSYSSIVDVSHNSFSGRLPNSWVNWNNFFYINMESNKLVGELPLDMSNMTVLEFINIGRNEFYGNVPVRMPPNLQLMILRSNQFVGNISPHLCHLSSLYILDLAHNKLSGSIPQCLHNITKMVLGESSSLYVYDTTFNLNIKGQELEYRYLRYLRVIDLSVNNLSGEIPTGLFGLVKVESLNLSHNHLTGTISKMLGDMKGLESLDLSYNQFVGEIPQSLSGLNFLEVLNLSYNSLSGQIPMASQLQTFEALSYVGNPELCGPPLTKNCTKEENLYKATQHAGGDPFKESFYLGMGVGFAVSFWGVCGSLFLIKPWRHTFFLFLNSVADRIYVFVALKFRNFEGR